jgi:hypothetical protein
MVLLTLALALAVLGVATACADSSGNDDTANADPVTPPARVEGDLEGQSGTDHVDWYAFTAGGGDYITVSGVASDRHEYTRVHIANSTGATQLSGRFNATSAARFAMAHLVPWGQAQGDWYLRVEWDTTSAGAGHYVVNLAVGDNVDLEPNGDKASARAIVPHYLEGRVSNSDRDDYYSFVAGNGTVLNITLAARPVRGRIHMHVSDWDGDLFSMTIAPGEGPVERLYHTANGTPERTIFIDVRLDAGTLPTLYNFTLALGEQDDAGQGTDASGRRQDPRAVLYPGQYYGLLRDEDVRDCYSFYITPGDMIVLLFESGSENGQYVHLVDPTGREVSSVGSKWWSQQVLRLQTARETSPGPWRVEVNMSRGLPGMDGEYSFWLKSYPQSDPGWDGDAPRDHSQARDLPNGTHQGLVDDWDIHDAYAFHAGRGSVINVTLEAEMGATIWLTLYREGERVYTLVCSDLEEVTDSLYTGTSTEMARFVIDVNQSLEGGHYTLTLDVGEQDDGGSGQDAGDLPADALPCPLGTEVQGHLEDLDIVEHYSLSMVPGDRVAVEFTSWAVIDQNLSLVTPGNEVVARISSMGGETRTLDHLVAPDAGEGDWFVRVHIIEPFHRSGDDYTFVVHLDHQEDAGQPGDAADARAWARTIGEGTFDGHIGDWDVCDQYSFEAGTGDIINLTFVPGTDRDEIWCHLYDPDDAFVCNLSIRDEDSNRVSYITSYETLYSRWHLKVFTVRGEADYSLTVQLDDQDDAGSGNDAPGTWDVPASWDEPPVIGEGVHRGLLGDRDRYDTYAVAVHSLMTLTVSVTNPVDEPMNVWVHAGATYHHLEPKLEPRGGITNSYTWEVPAGTAEGTLWYIRLNCTDGDHHYDYQLEIEEGGLPPDHDAPVITQVSVGEAREDLDLTFRFSIEDASPVKETVFVWWMEGTTGQEVTLRPDPSDTEPTVTIGSDDLSPGVLEYYVRATDVMDHAGHLGDVDEPLQVTVLPEPDYTNPEIVFEPPPAPGPGEDLVIELIVTDDSGVDAVTLYYRAAGETEWTEVTMTLGDDGNHSATIPADQLGGDGVEYYIVATDTSGNTETYGSVTNPVSLRVTPPREEEDDGPGFGAMTALLVVALAALLAGSRRRLHR